MTTSHESFKFAAEAHNELVAERLEMQAKIDEEYKIWQAEEDRYQEEAATFRAECDRKTYLASLDRAQKMLDEQRPAQWERDVRMMDNWSRANGLR